MGLVQPRALILEESWQARSPPRAKSDEPRLRIPDSGAGLTLRARVLRIHRLESGAARRPEPSLLAPCHAGQREERGVSRRRAPRIRARSDPDTRPAATVHGAMNPPPSEDLARHARALRRFARALCRGEHEAEDVTQDALVAALRMDGAPVTSLGSFLRGVTRNVARSRARRHARQRRWEEVAAPAEAVPSAGERAERLELDLRLIELVRELPPSQSEVVFLRYWEDLAPREIAKRLGLKVDAVKLRLKRGLATLRGRLDSETEGGRDTWMAALGGMSTTGAWSTPPLVTTALQGVLVKKLVLVGACALAALVAWNLRDSNASSPPELEPDERGADLVALDTSNEEPVRAAEAGDREALAQEAAPARPQHVYEVRGRLLHVVEGLESPGAGVAIRLEPAFVIGDFSHLPHTEVVTDEQGEFLWTLEWKEPKALSFAARVPADERFYWVYENFEVGGAGPREVELTVRRHESGPLRGRTVDVRGEPVAGVEVRSSDTRTPSGIVVSDERGEFEFESYRSDGSLVATKEGMSVLQTVRPVRTPEHSWPEALVVLAETATVRVRVEDTDGRPFSDGRVEILPAASEGEANATSGRLELPGGVATFEQAWPDVKLRIVLYLYGQTRRLSFTRVLDGVLVHPDDLDSGTPILVDEDPLELTIRLAPERVVSGVVLDPESGAPVPDAHVVLESRERRYHHPEYVQLERRTDENGRFELRVPTLRGGGDCLLTASDHERPYFHWDAGARVRAASVALDLAHDHSDLELALEATASLSGRVVDPAGEGLAAEVHVVSPRHGTIPWSLSTGFPASASCRKDGTFTIAGLPGDAFDLMFEHPDHARAFLRGVPANSDALEVTLEGHPTCSVNIRVRAPGCELEEVIVLRGSLTPVEEGMIPADPLPVRRTYVEPAGWPAQAAGMWYGQSGGTTESGRTFFNYWPIEGTQTVRNVHPGLYWFGAKGRTKRGEVLFPIGTGLVHVAPGSYELTFELVPTTSVEGRVLGVPTGSELHVAVADGEGALISLDGGGERLVPTRELAATGRFSWKAVPVGDHELWVGSRGALLRGEPAARRALPVRRGEPLEVELALE